MYLGKSKVVYKVYKTEQERNKTKKTRFPQIIQYLPCLNKAAK